MRLKSYGNGDAGPPPLPLVLVDAAAADDEHAQISVPRGAVELRQQMQAGGAIRVREDEQQPAAFEIRQRDLAAVERGKPEIGGDRARRQAGPVDAAVRERSIGE